MQLFDYKCKLQRRLRLRAITARKNRGEESNVKKKKKKIKRKRKSGTGVGKTFSYCSRNCSNVCSFVPLVRLPAYFFVCSPVCLCFRLFVCWSLFVCRHLTLFWQFRVDKTFNLHAAPKSA